MRLTLPLICLLVCAPLCAGIHDRDRPDYDALEDAVSVICGRFDRPPAQFFRVRHDNALSEINRLPTDPAAMEVDDIAAALPLFDDAAGALYKLGRFAEAIIVLDRKDVYVEHLFQQAYVVGTQHRVKTLSARAACLVARYRDDGPAADRRDLERANAQLERLRELDPFHREARYMQREVRWLKDLPRFDPARDEVFPNLLGLDLDSLPESRDRDALAALGHTAAPYYLLRRARHGDGWRNVDVFYALSLVLWIAGRDEEAVTAWLRVSELIDAGATTEVAGAPAAANLVRRMGAHLGSIQDLELHQRLYQEIRERNNARLDSRNRWIEENLPRGLHPDTHPDFWSDWVDPELEIDSTAPAPAPEEDRSPFVSTAFVVGGLTALAVLVFVLAALAMFISRRHPSAPTVDEV
jgi:hypothetical protein